RERVLYEIEHLQIANRLQHSHAVYFEAGVFKPLSGTRMRGKHHFVLARDLAENSGEGANTIGVVHVRWAVQRHDNCRTIHADFLPEAGGTRRRKRMEKAVDHDVSDKGDFFVGLTFRSQLRVSVARWSEQEGGEA